MYQKNSYVNIIESLKDKTQDTQNKFEEKEIEADELQTKLLETQELLNTVGQTVSPYEVYSDLILGISFNYLKSYSQESFYPSVGQTTPGGNIILKQGLNQKPNINIQINPEGSDLIANRTYFLKKVNNKLVIDGVISAQEPIQSDDPQGVYIVARYAESEGRGVIFTLSTNINDTESEYELLNLIRSFQFTK